ncbi:hypothetical protein ERJ75_001618300 [Trypanosoma vivax]|uniref:Uncharacterized protein n=1 Tax=Trypanosoma vivax (strain Y486) TaxID=1055687 RepID=G0TTC2_TRYVY|nr:hypothetical protein TRVL_00587 [Trypanosoma vivax]KAH8605815.1 hypothetical protein ERJ75_001618300 [Trypanosoma vivax]CCC47203.1 conserved hypothetical protein [Trypanosoma vivax Y486]
MAASNWNRLLPEPHVTAPGTEVIGGTHVHNNALLSHMDCATNKKADGRFPLTDWEMKAVQLYRELQVNTRCDSAHQAFLSNSTTGGLIQLVLQSKLPQITDWYERAHTIASWFSGPQAAPLALLPQATTQLITSHELTPFLAAQWLLDLSRALFKRRNTIAAQLDVVSAADWALANVLQTCVYRIQDGSQALFKCFSSLSLHAIVENILTSITEGDEFSCFLLPQCFLIRHCSTFALAAWEDGTQERLQRICELSRALPAHVATILSALL